MATAQLKALNPTQKLSKNVSVLCFSGWGQKYNSLEFIFKEEIFKNLNLNVSSFDYSSLFSFQEVCQNIINDKINPDIVVGWSLGGQILCRLIAAKIIKPKFLILIAPPFQLVQKRENLNPDFRLEAYMSKRTFDEFYQNFAKAPDKTLKKFAILTAMNDKNAAEIAKTLDINDKNHEQLKFWLEELGNFSCKDLDFADFPPCLYFHGSSDMIVHVFQAKYFQKIPEITTKIIEKCGHAPHLSQTATLCQSIFEKLNKL